MQLQLWNFQTEANKTGGTLEPRIFCKQPPEGQLYRGATMNNHC